LATKEAVMIIIAGIKCLKKDKLIQEIGIKSILMK
jgi:hypothetical protein